MQLRFTFLSFALVLWVCSFASPVLVQAEDSSERLSRLPPDSLAYFSIDMETIRSIPRLQIVPWEVLQVVSQDEAGFDVLDIQTIDGSIGLPSIMGVEFGTIIRTLNPYDIGDLTIDGLNEKQSSPRRQDLQFRQVEGTPIRIAQTDPRSVLVGSEVQLRQMLGQPPAITTRAFQVAKANTSAVSLVVSIESVRDLLLGFVEGEMLELPTDIVPSLAQLLQETDVVQLSFREGPTTGLSIDFYGKNDDSSKRITEALQDLIDVAYAEFLPDFLEGFLSNSGFSERLEAAVIDYVDRIKTAIQSSFKTVDGAIGSKVVRTEVPVAFDFTTIGVATGLILPAVQSAREAARRMQASNNLRQLMLAQLNYEATYRKFPNRIWQGSKEKPLLSWRIALLPFLDEDALYREFRLDEAWDSPHNMKLVERMPSVFQNPRVPLPPGMTNYVMPYGEELLGDLEGDLRFRDITDGSSNTIAIIEVSPEFAVPWTAPDDFDVDDFPLEDAFLQTGSNAAFWDGSIRFLSEFIDPGQLRSLLTHASGD